LPIARIEHRILALCAIIALLGWASRANASNALSFPPTEFNILDPQTNFPIGHGRYSIESTRDGAILRGVNQYDAGASDVETAKIEIDRGGVARLIEADHTFYKIDRSILQRSHIDLKASAGTCINNAAETKIEETLPLELPPDTWSGASVLIPIQKFLRTGETGTQHLHVFNCAPTAKIFAIDVEVATAPEMWAPYAAPALSVEVKPDFGWINLLIAPFVPKLHAWFDPTDDWSFAGSESARFYKGPAIMLVKTRRTATAQVRH
jgi:hypothetical protein